MSAIKLSEEHVGVMLVDLAAAARATENNHQACSYICSTVANLIAGSGSLTAQVRLMQIAERVGFTPEFGVGIIRVHWHTR